MVLIQWDEYFCSECQHTLEEQNRVAFTLSFGTLHSSIQVSGDSWEVLLDLFWIPVFQCVVIIAEHLVILEMKSRKREISWRYCSVWTESNHQWKYLSIIPGRNRCDRGRLGCLCCACGRQHQHGRCDGCHRAPWRTRWRAELHHGNPSTSGHLKVKHQSFITLQ